MKVSKYRELLSRIDTDRSTDEKIKNKLMYNQSYEENKLCNKQNEQRKILNKLSNKQNHTDDIGISKVLLKIFSKLTVVRQALPSLAFLIFFVVAILGLKRNLFDETMIPGSDLEKSSESTYESNVTITDEAAEVEITENLDMKTDETSEVGITEDSEVVSKEGDISEVTDTISEEAETTSSDFIVDTNENAVGDLDETANDTEEAETLVEDGNFYYAWFDVIADSKVKKSIPYLIVRLHGIVDTIDPSDLTDIVLTRDGEPIENSITLTDKVNQYEWNYENITDFYFEFAYENNEPGVYGLKGKYKGVPFTVYEKIIEASLNEEPADPEDLFYVTWGGFTDAEGNYIRLSELVFSFTGLQNAFYPSDLTELKLTRNNEEIEISFDSVTRYYEANVNKTGDTNFNLILKEELTESGTYVISGKYQGKSFSHEEIIP
jgi:hypothetical protein